MAIAFLPDRYADKKRREQQQMQMLIQMLSQLGSQRQQQGQFETEQERLTKQFETREERYAEETGYKREQSAAQKAETDEFNEVISSIISSQGKPAYTTIPGMAAPIPTGGEVGWRQLGGAYAAGGETAAAERIARTGVAGERAEESAAESAKRDAEIMAASNKLWMNAGEKAGVDMSILEGIAISGPDAVDISGVMKGAIQKTGGDATVDYRPVWRSIYRRQYPDATSAEIGEMVAGLKDQNPGASGSAALARGPGAGGADLGEKLGLVEKYAEIQRAMQAEDLDPRTKGMYEAAAAAIEQSLGYSPSAGAAPEAEAAAGAPISLIGAVQKAGDIAMAPIRAGREALIGMDVIEPGKIDPSGDRVADFLSEEGRYAEVGLNPDPSQWGAEDIAKANDLSEAIENLQQQAEARGSYVKESDITDEDLLREYKRLRAERRMGP